MSNFIQQLGGLFHDRPPDLAFEVGPHSLAFARLASGAQAIVETLAPGVILPSPLHDNMLDADAFATAVRKLAAHAGQSRKPRPAVLILPDHSARASVLDFDRFPEKPEEQLPLLHFRLKKTLPYDIDSAALSYYAQPLTRDGRREVLVVVTPLEVVSRYEAPFRAAGFHPGIVTVSHLAALDLVPVTGVIIVAKLSGGVLTVMVLDHGILRLVRSLELTEITLDEIAADLYPTFAYAEDNFGSRPETLTLCGFEELPDAARRFEVELGANVSRLPYRNAGLAGYLHSRKVQGVAA